MPTPHDLVPNAKPASWPCAHPRHRRRSTSRKGRETPFSSNSRVGERGHDGNASGRPGFVPSRRAGNRRPPSVSRRDKAQAGRYETGRAEGTLLGGQSALGPGHPSVPWRPRRVKARGPPRDYDFPSAARTRRRGAGHRSQDRPRPPAGRPGPCDDPRPRASKLATARQLDAATATSSLGPLLELGPSASGNCMPRSTGCSASNHASRAA